MDIIFLLLPFNKIPIFPEELITFITFFISLFVSVTPEPSKTAKLLSSFYDILPNLSNNTFLNTFATFAILRWMAYGIFGKNQKFEDFLILRKHPLKPPMNASALIKMHIIGYKSDIPQFLVTHLNSNFLSSAIKACLYASFMGTFNKI